jgi:hypothetical protein
MGFHKSYVCMYAPNCPPPFMLSPTTKAFCLKVVFLLLLSLSTPTSSGVFAEPMESSLSLHVLGVYEGHTHKYGKVTVFVAPQDHPIALLLTAYESVDWQLELEPGAQLARVFLNGYHEQRVSGLPAHIPVQSSSYDQGTSYLYGHDNNSCFKLIEKAEQLYGLRPRQYLCQYRGIAFVVDRNGIRPLPID